MAYLVNVTVRANGQTVSSEHRTVAQSKMTIGRSKDCDLRLNDTKKHVSRVHAVVDVSSTGYAITVVSKVNPVVLNGTQISPGECRPIKQGDVVEIGEFTMEMVEAFAPTSSEYSGHRATGGSPFDFGLGSGATTASDDPFKALEELAAPRPPTPSRHLEGPDPFFQDAQPPTGLVAGVGKANRQPTVTGFDSADPLFRLMSDGKPDTSNNLGVGPTFVPTPQNAGSLDHLLGPSSDISSGRPLVSFEKNFAGGSSSIDHVQPINVAFKPPPVMGDPRPSAPDAVDPKLDPFDGFDPLGSLIEPRPKPSPPAPKPASKKILESEPEPFKEVEAFAPVEPDLAPPSAPSAYAGARSAHGPGPVTAFLEGAGLTHLKISDEDADQFLRESGAIVKAAVEGLVGLLLARSEMKKEMRAEDRTMMGSQDNNPLKLMTDSQEAIAFLFDPNDRISGAFLQPVQAVQDACADMRAHEIAMMAGMRAALQGALKRFDPQALEREFDKRKSLISLNKKVKLWDFFVDFHNTISAEAEDDLLKAFGRDLVGTYSAQVRRLRSK